MSAWEVAGRLLLSTAVLAVVVVVVADTVRAARRDVARYRAIRDAGQAELEADLAELRQVREARERWEGRR